MLKLTDRQKMVLQKRADGFCYRGNWKWTCNGEPVTREVNTLNKRGLIELTFFPDRGATNPTESGRAMLEKN